MANTHTPADQEYVAIADRLGLVAELCIFRECDTEGNPHEHFMPRYPEFMQAIRADLVALLLDIEHCSDALMFRPDLVKRLREFAALSKATGEKQ